MLTISLLGTPAFALDHQSISPLVTGRAAALLIYLALTRQPQPRARLADLLWKNLPEVQAKTNLRYRLSDLRKVVGDYVVATGDTVAFNQDLPHWVDVTVFATYMAALMNPTTPTVDPEILHELLKLYSGEFLSGFQVEDAPIFEHWLLAQRRYLHDLLVQGLQLRTQQHLAHGEYAAGLALNHDLLTLEPWREEAHRQRMLLLAYSGQRSAALQQYTRCCQVLTEELDVPPMPQTTELYNAIKSGQWFPDHKVNGHSNGYGTNGHHMPAAVTAFLPATLVYRQSGAALPAPSDRPVLAATKPRFDLGAMPNGAHFYGRQAELTTLHSWLGQEHSRLVALLGLSGQGKTALAAALVYDVIEDEQNPAHGFTHVIWRSLHSAPTCTELLHGWLQQLETGPEEALPASFDELITRLFALLQTHRCLLVLDGVEALLTTPADVTANESYRPGCEAYATLFRLFFERRHRSCLLLTSRLRPVALTQLDERNGAFHSLDLAGLPVAEGKALLAAHGIVGSPAMYQQLHDQYAGNPLLLSQAANLIQELFAGDGAAFLQEELAFLGNIGAMLAQQVAQLAPLEQQILYQLATAKQPLTRQTLWAQLTPAPGKGAYFQALQRLQRTFLLQSTNEQIKLAAPFAGYLAEHTLSFPPHR